MSCPGGRPVLECGAQVLYIPRRGDQSHTAASPAVWDALGSSKGARYIQHLGATSLPTSQTPTNCKQKLAVSTKQAHDLTDERPLHPRQLRLILLNPSRIHISGSHSDKDKSP